MNEQLVQNSCTIVGLLSKTIRIYWLQLQKKAWENMIIDPTIGIRIKYIRELNHYTREELAEYADISSKFLYEIENGQKGLSATNLLKICKALEVSCDYILTGNCKARCNEELVNIIEMFDTTQIANVKKILLILLEVSKL